MLDRQRDPHLAHQRRSKSQGGKKTLADVQRQLAEGTDLQGLYAPARTTSLTDTFDRNRDNTTIEFYAVGRSQRAVLAIHDLDQLDGPDGRPCCRY